jgi:hypothetical protein
MYQIASLAEYTGSEGKRRKCGKTFTLRCLHSSISPPPHGSTAPSGQGSPHYRGFTITLRHTTFRRTPLDEWSARHRDLYLTTHNIARDSHPFPWRDSNPQPQQASGRRPTSYTSRLLGSAVRLNALNKNGALTTDRPKQGSTVTLCISERSERFTCLSSDWLMTCLFMDTPYYPGATRDNPLKLATTASFHFTSHSHHNRPMKELECDLSAVLTDTYATLRTA